MPLPFPLTIQDTVASCLSPLGLLWQSTTGWVASTKSIYFLMVLEARKSKMKVPADHFLVRALFLACRQLPTRHVLAWPLLSACTQKVCERERVGRASKSKGQGRAVGVVLRIFF